VYLFDNRMETSTIRGLQAFPGRDMSAASLVDSISYERALMCEPLLTICRQDTGFPFSPGPLNSFWSRHNHAPARF